MTIVVHIGLSVFMSLGLCTLALGIVQVLANILVTTGITSDGRIKVRNMTYAVILTTFGGMLTIGVAVLQQNLTPAPNQQNVHPVTNSEPTENIQQEVPPTTNRTVSAQPIPNITPIPTIATLATPVCQNNEPRQHAPIAVRKDTPTPSTVTPTLSYSSVADTQPGVGLEWSAIVVPSSCQPGLR